ncbi:metalloregulator ArsR/SmtB family transcription factor [Frigoribacterium sp. UYMn621]|uniref:ArsR/SmtB family transcription factor n=1 Tax=Frigoribacterium sp. UYMn621 TaxID=3156343 RepID=UPI0033989398
MTPTVTQTFAAIGDPIRSTIVDRLASSDATVGELVALFEISFQAVSQHLDVLERAGLLTRRREGRTRRVQLVLEPLEEALTWMESRRDRLEQRYARLDDLLDTLSDSTETPEERP